MNAYFISQFICCPLVWMNHSRTLNNRIIGLHKRALSLVYNDFSSSFSEFFAKDKSVTLHHRNLQILAYEIFKVKRIWRSYKRKAIIVLEVAQHYNIEVLKMSCMAQKLFLV